MVKHTRDVVPNAEPLAFHMFFLVLFTLYIYIGYAFVMLSYLSQDPRDTHQVPFWISRCSRNARQKLLIHKGAMVDRYPHGCSDFSENPGSQALGMSQSSQRFHNVPLFKGHEWIGSFYTNQTTCVRLISHPSDPLSHCENSQELCLDLAKNLQHHWFAFAGADTWGS